LRVTFKSGSSITHTGVPREAFDNFANYYSAGIFYHSVIKRYPILEEKHGSKAVDRTAINQA